MSSVRMFRTCQIMLLLCIGSMLMVAEPGRKLPDFLKKVQLHNFAGLESTEDGKGVKLYRLPAGVRAELTEENKGGKSSGDQMRYARHSEIRFVLKEGEKPQNVNPHFSSGASAAAARKPSAGVFLYFKCRLTKQMQCWRRSRRANRWSGTVTTQCVIR